MTWDGPTVLYAAARWLGYLAAFVVIGSAAARWLLLPKLDAGTAERGGRQAILWARSGAVLLAVALLARLYFQTRSLMEPEDSITIDFLEAVLASRWGKGWLAQSVAAMVTLIGWRWLAKRPMAPGAARTTLAGSIAVILTAPLTGHAVGLAEAPSYTPLLDLIHFGAGAIWLGTLGVVVRVVRVREGAAVAPVIEAFSPIALVAGLVTMAAGAVMAWNYLGGLTPLVSTVYGKTLLLKLLALGATAGIGGYNWRVVLPRLRRGVDAPIQFTARAELLVGVLILALTAFLVALPAPGEHPE